MLLHSPLRQTILGMVRSGRCAVPPLPPRYTVPIIFPTIPVAACDTRSHAHFTVQLTVKISRYCIAAGPVITIEAAHFTGPWPKPLNMDLHVKHYEPHIPFSIHVTPERTPKPSSSRTSRFGQLHAELQIHILCCCDASTLFQLMHVSCTDISPPPGFKFNFFLFIKACFALGRPILLILCPDLARKKEMIL